MLPVGRLHRFITQQVFRFALRATHGIDRQGERSPNPVFLRVAYLVYVLFDQTMTSSPILHYLHVRTVVEYPSHRFLYMYLYLLASTTTRSRYVDCNIAGLCKVRCSCCSYWLFYTGAVSAPSSQSSHMIITVPTPHVSGWTRPTKYPYLL